MKLNYALISPLQMRDYLKGNGWELVTGWEKIDRYVMEHAQYTNIQMVFPLDTTKLDYGRVMERIVMDLAKLKDASPQRIFIEVLQTHEDMVRYQLRDEYNQQISVPLTYVIAALEGAKNLILAGATNVLSPKVFHRKQSRREALAIVDSAKFQHTQPGSFILTVSTPLGVIHPVQTQLIDTGEHDAGLDHLPLARKTTLAIAKGLSAMVKAIKTDTLDSFVDGIKTEQNPVLSSNFCNALLNFRDDKDRFSMAIEFDWAPALPVGTHWPYSSVIKIEKDYFSRIAEVKSELEHTEERSPQEQSFMATVEKLNGELDDYGRREGEVVLFLTNAELNEETAESGKTVKVRTLLTAEQYELANKAHMNKGSFIHLKGKLVMDRPFRKLDGISMFKLITSE